jgi:uncharacterized protein (DUF58 family)
VFQKERAEALRKFLDPRIISQLKGLDLKARLIVEGFLVGLHKSPFHGFSVEFKEHRPYAYGDEPRWIDWKVFARTDRFYVKKFEEETNLRAYILLDASRSMDYPKTNSKLEYAKNLAAALSFLFFLQRDATGLLVFDEALRKYLVPRSTKAHLNEVFKTLARVRGRGRTKPYPIFRKLAERIQKRGMIILLSDLYMEPDTIVRALRHFRHKKHEVMVFHILSPQEINLPTKPAIFEDMETQDRVSFDPQRMKSAYSKRLEEHFKKLKRELLEALITYERMTTETPFDKALLSYLKKREKLH